ncbi:MAG: helix-turn-helix domain-containing protein [Chromatiaceae bacterium]|nr:helix-turn-helix domain-containing protein [Chromatiaceae bacterium]MCP5440538.1 helix-turn-helix domain-containing protein [Chromatiaceae bacterium]
MTILGDKAFDDDSRPEETSWRGQDAHGYGQARRHLPVRTDALTQLGRGKFDAKVTVINGEDAALSHAIVGTRSSALTDLHEDYTAFLIPIAWDGTLVINGEEVTPSSIYMPVANTLYQVYGASREILAVGIPRDDFIATVAALRGIGREAVQLGEGGIEMAPALLAQTRQQLVKMLKNYSDAAHQAARPSIAAKTLTADILSTVTELYLHARQTTGSTGRIRPRYGLIVRKAEERFASAQGDAVSLADLCAAAGVSQGTLYNAFLTMCDCTPIEYFKKRRLTEARIALLGASAKHGAIKRAALGAGLTHLGRFSAEYRDLFNESPRTTLNRSLGRRLAPDMAKDGSVS